ncbi:MAG TPA: 30S ribosomal protein S12 methylthiotransferase RimO [Candidatus Deferrimicrobium sp.]|nr:30S ribosomal protein S12 methylthiotransferase RimO [Candidatus Deferrimicrobium sp.]
MKFYIHKLGCPKNDVDADYISARLVDDGHESVSDPLEAESIIVNTCGFILPAREESINEILRLGQLKKSDRRVQMYATGCLSQRYGDELLTEIPELDGAFGLGELDSLAKAVTGSAQLDRSVRTDAHRLDYLAGERRFIGDDLPYAYLKISDGCNRGCTYCAIPAIRGRYRSRSVDDIVREAEYLSAHGKRELILVSQEATLYGQDLQGRPNIIDLLRELDRIERVRWIRLMYLHPARLDDDLIEYVTGDNKTLGCFDLPLQHANTEMLTAMGRGTDRAGIERLLSNIRQVCPDAVLRTTFILGFPGETDDRFQELVDFVSEQRFDRLGAYTYSLEEGTIAATMADQVPEAVKAKRLDELMELQREIAWERNEDLIGSVQEVIIDSRPDDGPAVGRTRGDCPEVDQEVYVHGEGPGVGRIVRVRIESADGFDLHASLCEGERHDTT